MLISVSINKLLNVKYFSCQEITTLKGLLLRKEKTLNREHIPAFKSRSFENTKKKKKSHEIENMPNLNYSKTCVKQPLKNRQNKDLNDKL